MSDDNEEYERSRDEANRLADMETQVTAGPVIAKIPAAVGASRTARSAGRCGEPPASAGLETQVSP
jgi:hypothetical protein